MDRYSIRRASGPMEEPMTLGEAKAHLRIDSDQTADDDLVASLLSAAREDCEDFCNRCFVWSAWELRLDAFPCGGRQEILLPRPPLVGVTGIFYVDADGVERELGSDNYQVDPWSEPARIWPAYDKSWPQTRHQQNAVRVEYVAGYPVDDAGSPTDYAAHVPEAIKAAIKLQLGHYYRNRENVVVGVQALSLPQGAEHLLWKLRVDDFRLST